MNWLAAISSFTLFVALTVMFWAVAVRVPNTKLTGFRPETKAELAVIIGIPLVFGIGGSIAVGFMFPIA